MKFWWQDERQTLALILGELAGLRQAIEDLQSQIQKGALTMSKEMDDLTSQVTANTSVEASAITLLTNLTAALTAAKNDPAAIEALVAQLETSKEALAAAIVANTPAAPAAPAAPATN